MTTSTDEPTDQSPAGPASTSSGPRPPISPMVLAAVAVTVVLGVLVARQLVTAFAPHLYTGTVLQGDTPAPAMDGLSFARTGQPVDLPARRGEFVVVFFGYTNCPDVCPASMALAAQAVGGMRVEDRARTDVWMVSVDPQRDDPASLQEYVEFFDPDFDGISGPVDAIDRVATGYGVFYELGPTAADGADDYLVDHTASLFGIGPDGSLRIVWPPTVSAEQIRADIEALL